MSGGKRRAAQQRRPPVGSMVRLAGYAIGAILGCFIWWFLVRAAIEFGRVAVAGIPRAWWFTGAATVGAVGCLLLVLVLISRVLVGLGLVSDYRPRRAAARRRAVPREESPAAAPGAQEQPVTQQPVAQQPEPTLELDLSAVRAARKRKYDAREADSAAR